MGIFSGFKKLSKVGEKPATKVSNKETINETNAKEMDKGMVIKLKALKSTLYKLELQMRYGLEMKDAEGLQGTLTEQMKHMMKYRNTLGSVVKTEKQCIKQVTQRASSIEELDKTVEYEVKYLSEEEKNFGEEMTRALRKLTELSKRISSGDYIKVNKQTVEGIDNKLINSIDTQLVTYLHEQFSGITLISLEKLRERLYTVDSRYGIDFRYGAWLILAIDKLIAEGQEKAALSTIMRKYIEVYSTMEFRRPFYCDSELVRNFVKDMLKN